MNKVLLFFACILLSQSASAQTGDLIVIGSAGNSFEANSIHLDWTIGEPMVTTFEANEKIITQGFHQAGYTLVAVEDLPENFGSINIFPNPFVSNLFIEATFFNTQKGVVEVHDSSGKMLWRHSFKGYNISQTYNASSLPSGSYFITLRLEDHLTPFTYQLLKIQ